MKFRTLLLGTASAFAAVGGAQAADLAVAEPVQYVMVCSVYGDGFFYVPGTDTCVKIGAYVFMQVNFGDAVVDARGYTMKTEGRINVTGMWSSELGDGKLYLEITGTDADPKMGLGDAYFSIGPWTFGKTGSVANLPGGYTDYGGPRNDHGATQASFHTSMGGMGFAVGVEEGTVHGASWNSMPDLTLAITGSAGGVDGKLTAAYADRFGGDGYGVGGALTADMGGIAVRGVITWEHNLPSFGGGTDTAAGGEGDSWSALASFKAPLGAGVNLVGTVGYFDPAGAATTTAALGVQADLARNVSGWVEGMWSTTGGVDTWGVGARIKAALPGT